MDWREIGRWLSSVTFHIVTKYFSTKKNKKTKSLHSSVYLHEGIIEDLWMEVGAMTWMADGCSDCEYEKLESEVDRYYIIWLFHIQIAVRIRGSKLSQSSITSDCWVTAEEAWLCSCWEWQGGWGVRDHACTNTGMNETRMHGNMFFYEFIDGQSGASEQHKNDAEIFSGKMAWKELTL